MQIPSEDRIINRTPPKDPNDKSEANADNVMLIFDKIVNGDYRKRLYQATSLPTNPEIAEYLFDVNEKKFKIYYDGKWNEVGGGKLLVDYLVSNETELLEALSNIKSYQSIGIKGNICLSDTITLPVLPGIRLIGLGGSLITPKNGHSILKFTSRNQLDWIIDGVVFRCMMGVYEKINNYTIRCLTQDRPFQTNELAGKRLATSMGYETPYYLYNIVSNTEDTITVNTPIQNPNLPIYLYWIIPDNAEQAMIQTNAFTDIMIRNCIFNTHSWSVFSGNYLNILKFINNKVVGRYVNNLFYGTFQSSIFQNNFFSIGDLQNESLMPLEYYFYLYGGYCIVNRIAQNFFNAYGYTTPTKNVIYWNETSASYSVITIENNWFRCKAPASGNDNYIIYLNASGSPTRFVFANVYNTYFGQQFLRDCGGAGEVAHNNGSPAF
jgi:hypothetical protein